MFAILENSEINSEISQTAGRWRGAGEQSQWFAAKFPVRLNREAKSP
jgi:hypothetical protein